MSDSGKLYIVSTPIGNLKDITLRALETLNSVDLIACEDTRHTIKLLNHFNIKKRLISYFEHNKREKGEYLLSLMKEGHNVALVSDAGTPAISDPGEELVQMALMADITVVPVPGPVACITALVGSGFPTGRFVFEGFLPVNKRSKRERILEIKGEKRTIIFYEAPHKLLSTLESLLELLGDRKIVLARELTKHYEEFLSFSLSEAVSKFKEESPKGEFVLILEGLSEDLSKADEKNLLVPEQLDSAELSRLIRRKVHEYLQGGTDKKSAIKMVAKDLNMNKRETYMIYSNSEEIDP